MRATSPTWRPWSNRSCRTLSGCSSIASGSCTSHQSFLWHWRPEVKRDLERRYEIVLLRQGQRIDASIRVKRCPDRTNHRGLAGQPRELTDPEYRLDAGTMRAQQIDQPRGVEFLGRPRERPVLCREQLQAPDHALYRARPHHPTRPAGWTGRRGGAATTQEYPGSDVNPGQRGRVLFRELAPQGRETTRVVAVVVAQHDVRHAREVDAELARILEHRLGAVPRVEQEAAPVGLHEGGEPPLAHAPIREHGRENRDVEGLDLMSRGGRLATSDPGCDQQCRQRGGDSHGDHNGLPLGRTSLIWTQTHPFARFDQTSCTA